MATTTALAKEGQRYNGEMSTAGSRCCRHIRWRNVMWTGGAMKAHTCGSNSSLAAQLRGSRWLWLCSGW
eukprot:8829195-Alexandrium_andersonii.AAC.1